jgi:phage shock protein E
MITKDVLYWLVPVLVILGFILMKQLGQVKPDQATGLLAKGAVVIDVRGTGEFAGDHLAGAVNIPLNELETRIGGVVPDKSTPVLLHCLSGTRSAMAKRTLDKLGYTDVHNLGSLQRARSIIAGASAGE